MAMPEASSVPAHSAEVVGNAFVEQYYHVLHKSPEVVHRFYLDSSFLSRSDSNGVMRTVTTMKAINDMILSLNYEDYKGEIETADAQDSYEGGVIVLVTGSLTGKDNMRKKFTQSFFLAPQEKGFFVLNDVFRFVEENKPLQVNSVPENGIDESALIAPVTPEPEPAHVPDHHVLDSGHSFEEEDLDNGAEVCDPSDNEEGSVIEEEVVEPPAQSDQSEPVTVVEPAPIAQDDPPKKSYASIVKVMRGSTVSTPARVPTSTARVAAANTDRQSRSSAKPAPESEESIPISDSVPENNNVHEEAEGYSIYIRNLPLNATAPELEEVFKKFGPIKHDGVQVRSNKGFCFGFVEFESMSAMQSALEASPITIGDRQAVVEEKRTTTRVGSSGRGRSTSGRGGFRSDGFRGRGNFGGGRGYGRNEFRNQGEFSGRPRGPTGRSGDGYQRVNQNGNGRGGRQGGTNRSAVPA